VRLRRWTGCRARDAGDAKRLAWSRKHGARNWGIAQADRYANGLFALFELLADFPEMARERREFTPAVRIHPSGAHLVISRADGQGIEIIRILHAHQNLTAYLPEG